MATADEFREAQAHGTGSTEDPLRRGGIARSPNARGFEVYVESSGRTSTVWLSGHLEAASGPALWAVIEELVTSGQRDLTLDMTHVQSIDQAVLAAVAKAERAFGGTGAIRIEHASSSVLHLLRATGAIEAVEADGATAANPPNLALSGIGPLQCRALVLYFVEEQTIDEIAAETRCPVPVIHEALIDGINALRRGVSARPKLLRPPAPGSN